MTQPPAPSAGQELRSLAPGDLPGSLLRALGVLRSDWVRFLSIAMLCFIGVVAVAYIRVPRFESAAKLLVQLDVRNVELSPADERYSLAMRMADEAISTQAELLRSRVLLEEVVDRLGDGVLDAPPRELSLASLIAAAVRATDTSVRAVLASAGLIELQTKRDALISKLEKGLNVLPARKSQTIDISLQLKHRTAPPLVLKTLLDVYRHKLVAMDAEAQDLEAIQARTNALRISLEQAEADLAEFKRKYAIADLPLQRTHLLQRIDRLSGMLDGLASGGGGEGGAGAEQGAEQDLARLVARVGEFRIESSRRAALFQAGHPQVEEIDSQIKTAQSLLDKRLAGIRGTLAGHRERLTEIDGLEPELQRLQRQVQIWEDNYRAYAKASETRRLAQEQKQRVNVLVVDPPSTPKSAMPPSRLMLILAGLIGAIVFAATLVLVRSWWGRRSAMARAELNLEGSAEGRK